MVVFFSVFVAAFFLFHSSSVHAFNSDRITNGTDAPPGMYPYLTAIYSGFPTRDEKDLRTRANICSSTIISKRHILTAAHCLLFASKVVHPEAPLLIHEHVNTARVSLLDVRPKEKDHTYVENLGAQTKFYIHPSYFSGRGANWDIAIIEFPNGTDFGIAPIEIASNYVPKEGDMATAAGYGNYKFHPNPADPNNPLPERPTVLQHTKIPVHPPPDCDKKKILCTSNITTWPDEGDSGGPLLMERNGSNYQVGVASYKIVAYFNGTYRMAYVFYTELSYYCDWIQATTKGEASCVEMPDESGKEPPKNATITTTQKPPTRKTTAKPTVKPPSSSVKPKPSPDADSSGTRFFDAAKIVFVLLGSFILFM